jgi:hypothetical protein
VGEMKNIMIEMQNLVDEDEANKNLSEDEKWDMAAEMGQNLIAEMEDYKITDIQLFDYAEKRQTSEEGDFEIVYSYSANVIINDSFIIQIWGNENECGFDGVTDPVDAFWTSEDAQETALNEIDTDDLETALEADGFENNIGWLEENATDVMNPENAKYRT